MSELVFGSDLERFGNAVYRLERDIYALGDMEQWMRSRREAIEEVPTYDVESFVGYAHGIFDISRIVLQRGAVEDVEPQTKFGKKLKAASFLTAGTVDSENSDYCIEVEPRLVRSLAYNERFSRISNKSNPGNMPAVILLDDKDQPFGYQKGSGTDIVYTWGASTIDTQSGSRNLPADAFSFIELEDDLTDQLLGMDEGLVALRATAKHITKAGIARLSTQFMSPTIKETFAQAAAERVFKLHENKVAARNFRPRDIERRVKALYKKNDLPIL